MGAAPRLVQMHLALPFKKQPRDDPRVGRLLAEGWRIVNLQRVTDKEVAITLSAPQDAPAAPGS